MADAPHDLIAELRAVPIFEGLPDELLEWLAREGRLIALSKGERLFEPGAAAQTMFVMLNGTIHIERKVGAQFIGTLTLHAGAVSGVLPYSRMRVYQGRAQALEPTRMLAIERDRFPARRFTAIGRASGGVGAGRGNGCTRSHREAECTRSAGQTEA